MSGKLFPFSTPTDQKKVFFKRFPAGKRINPFPYFSRLRRNHANVWKRS